MSAAGGIWSTIAHLQGKPASPVEALRRIDDIATGIGHRYVVWVEDLERFAGQGGGNGHESVEEAERLNPIRALLYGLDTLESMTVITATTSLHVRFDLDKIARYVEVLPELPGQEILSILARFRQGCRERANMIDPADASARRLLDDLADYQGPSIRRALLGTGVHSISDGLVALCSTPRVLKQGLRCALDRWDRLAGEIDLDDVLVMSIVREARPDVFALIQEHIDTLRGRGFSEEGLRKARERWEASLATRQLDDRTRSAIGEVIKFVFNPADAELKPQGLRRDTHTDYWERFLAVPILSETERDQNVLRVMISESEEDLIRVLEDRSLSAAVESFARLLSTVRLRRLLVPLIKRRCEERPSEWPDGNPPGVVPVWRMWLRRAERGELRPSEVLDEVRHAEDEALPRNIYLAIRIEQYFVLPGAGVHNMLDAGGTTLVEEAKQHLRDLVLAAYGGKPGALADALVGAPTPTLLWVCWGIDRVRAGNMAGEPFPGWPILARTILDAAMLKPVEISPQIAGLVVRESTMLDGSGEHLVHRYDFDDRAAANLFGSVDAVLDVCEPHDASRWSEIESVRAVFRAVLERRSGGSS